MTDPEQLKLEQRLQLVKTQLAATDSEILDRLKGRKVFVAYTDFDPHYSCGLLSNHGTNFVELTEVDEVLNMNSKDEAMLFLIESKHNRVHEPRTAHYSQRVLNKNIISDIFAIDGYKTVQSCD
jgi:hypothetical protein